MVNSISLANERGIICWIGGSFPSLIFSLKVMELNTTTPFLDSSPTSTVSLSCLESGSCKIIGI